MLTLRPSHILHVHLETEQISGEPRSGSANRPLPWRLRQGVRGACFEDH